jgi:hypothetical protein
VRSGIAVATQLNSTRVGFSDIHHIGAMVRVQHMLAARRDRPARGARLRRIKLIGAIAETPT